MKTYTVWIYGSVLAHAGWLENQVLHVEEGFTSRTLAARWARSALKHLVTPVRSPSRYKIGPGF